MSGIGNSHGTLELGRGAVHGGRAGTVRGAHRAATPSARRAASGRGKVHGRVRGSTHALLARSRGFFAPWPRLLAATLLLTACGGGDPVTADPDIAAFVGDWEATEFRITSDANPDATFDVAENGSFLLSVEPSGHYTAILQVDGAAGPSVEQGRMEVSGSTVILDPDTGSSATATFTFQGADRVLLEGPTEFDFNFDGSAEPAEARIVLERR